MLALLVRLGGFSTVVEIGTLFGYSGIRLARALPADGHLYTLEVDERHAEVAAANFAGAGLADRVTIVTGKATDVLDEVPTPAAIVPTLEGMAVARRTGHDR